MKLEASIQADDAAVRNNLLGSAERALVLVAAADWVVGSCRAVGDLLGDDHCVFRQLERA